MAEQQGFCEVQICEIQSMCKYGGCIYHSLLPARSSISSHLFQHTSLYQFRVLSSDPGISQQGKIFLSCERSPVREVA